MDHAWTEPSALLGVHSHSSSSAEIKGSNVIEALLEMDRREDHSY